AAQSSGPSRPRRLRWAGLIAAAGGWPRRALAVGLLLAAAVVWLRGPDAGGVAAATSRPGVSVLIAARDLAAGTTLTAADLRAATIPSDLVAAGAVRPGARLAGRVIAGAVRRGEAITDARLVGPGL